MQSTGRVLAEVVEKPRSPAARAKGLLGRCGLQPGHALLLEPAYQIHTFGMRFPIDVVFVDDSWRVVRVIHCMKPWRVTLPVPRGRRALELPCGAAGTDVVVVARLEAEETPSHRLEPA